jgi:hypothetical protein
MKQNPKKNWQLKERARKLRELGWTYKEIKEEVPAHKVTLSKWCKDIKLTPKQIAFRGKRYANRLKGAKANQSKREKERQKILIEARKEIRPLTNYEFKAAGTMLYWAEGSKTHNLGVSNSDPKIIEFTMEWFRKICHVADDKFKAILYLHTGLNENKTKKYWSRLTNIPLSQFGKTIFKQEGEASRKNNQYQGTIKIEIFNENLKHRILSWIKELASNKRP